MAEYTIELRKIVEGGKNIFPFNYPFYDEKKRPDFEKRFIKHFYFREIGCETVDRFIHYLDDKMNTVFPYYNELFKTAAIEYSVLDNYNIKETTTMKRENVGASSGESYSVGKILNEQTTETDENRTSNRIGSSETTRNTTNESDETANTSRDRDGSEDETNSSKKIKKFLDTPQGQVDLTDSKYLTTLGDDTEDGDRNKTLTETESSETSATKTSSGEETSDYSDNVAENSEAKTSNTFTGEERTTADNNTRTRSEGSTTETIEHTRKGNIGVDTDADMIQKHIKLQKILTQIEKMFFDECEDLFMLVW